MASTYRFFAEEIRQKLDLIDVNKNFLQYPYTGAFPTGLIDVGDGSILTSGTSAGTTSLELGPASLLAGDYQICIAVTTIAEAPVDLHGFSLSITGDGVSQTGNNIKVTSETAAVVTLNIPSSFSSNWLIKPQIIKSGEDSTIWVPYMDKIGAYVDRRFNGTNAKLKTVLKLMDCIEIIEVED